MPFEMSEEVIQAISEADEIAQEDLRQSPLAATALHHGLRMVTRNERDFVYQGLDVVNPWSRGDKVPKAPHKAIKSRPPDQTKFTGGGRDT